MAAGQHLLPVPQKYKKKGQTNMKKVFLIDTENIGKAFLAPAATYLTTSDVLVVFNNRIRRADFSQAILDGLAKIKATIRKVYLESASKNAMDFALM